MGLRKGRGQSDRVGESADSGHGEILHGNGEIWILVMAGKWLNSVFLAAKFVVKICGELFVLVFVHS